MDKTVVGVKRDEKREVELFGEPRDQGFVKGGRDLDLERVFKRDSSSEIGMTRSCCVGFVNTTSKRMTSVRLSVERRMSKDLPRPYFDEAWLARKSTFETKVSLQLQDSGSTSSTSVPCFTDQDRASDPSRRMTRIVGLLQQAKDVLNGNKAGHNFATFKKNARQAFPSITLPKSNRRSDGFVPRALKGTLGPAFENKRRLRWGRVSLIEGAEVVVDETGKTTIGEVVSAVLPLLNESCLLQDIEHDIAIQMSHGSIPLTRRETARSDSREFEVRGELVDGPVLLKSYTKLVVHNANITAFLMNQT
ncbi:hypothetical protein BD769DRAFT_1393068 [Suillus cothurnatus]|nr:hypothetical protein BD769DRAFT_1393068 [Suillus cothurnatus]